MANDLGGLRSTAFAVRPGQAANCPLAMASVHVDMAGEKQAAWSREIRSACGARTTLYAWTGPGLQCGACTTALLGMGAIHNPVVRSRLPVRMIVLPNLMVTVCRLNMAVQPISQSWPTDKRFFVNPGTARAVVAAGGSGVLSTSSGMVRNLIDVIVFPSGNSMSVGSSASNVSPPSGVVCDVAPESTMKRMFGWVDATIALV